MDRGLAVKNKSMTILPHNMKSGSITAISHSQPRGNDNKSIVSNVNTIMSMMR